MGDNIEPQQVSARSQQSAYAETGDISSVCAECVGPLRIEARYDDPWQTPITGAPIHIQDSNGVLLAGVEGGPSTLGLINFGAEDGQPNVPNLRPDLGTFTHPQVQRGGVEIRLMANPSAQANIARLETELIVELSDFAEQMQAVLQPWISEWQNSGWWGVINGFLESVGDGLVAWWEGEGEFWDSAWEAITNLPDMIVEGAEQLGDAAVALWNNKHRIFELLKAFAKGSIEEIENIMTALANALRSIPGLDEITNLLVGLVENSAEWAASMIEMATKTRVLSILFGTMGGIILMIPPTFWAEAFGTLSGYLIPEIILAIIFALITYFTAGAGGAALSARIGSFVAKVTTKLSSSGRIGAFILRIFNKISTLGHKIIELIRWLKKSVSEMRRGLSEGVVRILRSSSRRINIRRRRAPPRRDLDTDRINELGINHEQGGRPDLAEGVGGARYEASIDRPLTRSTTEGIDFYDGDTPISLKGPIANRLDGVPIEINNNHVDGLANAVVKDARYNTANNDIVVDTLGMSPEQRSRLLDQINNGLDGFDGNMTNITILE